MNEVKTLRARHLSQRYKELLREYHQQGLAPTMLEICEVISHETAPRFYVTEEYAINTMYAIRNGRTQVTRQLKDIYRRWRRSRDIIAVINSPAPSYYLSAIRIYRILIATIRQV